MKNCGLADYEDFKKISLPIEDACGEPEFAAS